MKDDLIDEEKARQEEAAHETLKQKIDRYNNRTCKIWRSAGKCHVWRHKNTSKKKDYNGKGERKPAAKY